jgi:TusA-related sulfurtransferase
MGQSGKHGKENTMSDIVDTRGLSCPQPVLLVMSRIKDLESGEVQVIVDNEVSRENVSRAARSQGWEIREELREGEVRLILKR